MATITGGSARVSSEILDRMPPHSLEAERSILGSILLVPELCDEVVLLVSADDFYADPHRKIFGHLVEMHNEGLRIDENLLSERLRTAGEYEAVGGRQYLFEVCDAVASPATAPELAKIVREKATLRKLIHASTEILRDSFDPTQEPRELLSRAEEKIFLILDQRGGTQISEFKDVLLDACDRIDARLRRGAGISGLATGYPDLDTKTGGFHGSELLILAGRPSMGKSALAANIAEHVAIHEKVGTLFISLEMSKLELAERMMCSQAQVNGHKLRNGFAKPEDQKKIIKVCSEMSHAPLYIDDSPSRNITEISATARRLKHRQGLGLIVIDYLQLIEPDNQRDPRQEQVAKIARRLKGMARELNVPILCLAQLNRQAEASKDNKPRLSHLRESGAIEQDADVVMFVHREEYYCNSPEEKEAVKGEAELILAKQRNGPVGSVPLTFVDEYAAFRSRAPESMGFGADAGQYFDS